ncbi:MAG TPA: hypothetical protein VN778_02945 [Verrucomicrobiae bacterium]|nr:hypothetical protein [Verrucomicrobiae bacterium]
MADKNIDLFSSSHSSKRIKLAARKLGVTNLNEPAPPHRGLPSADQEQSDIM